MVKYIVVFASMVLGKGEGSGGRGSAGGTQNLEGNSGGGWRE